MRRNRRKDDWVWELVIVLGPALLLCAFTALAAWIHRGVWRMPFE